MLIDNRCSIYEHRPMACRTYDCRIFPAAGVAIEDDRQALIARRARRWQFAFPTPTDRTRHDAVRAAATFLDEHPGLLPDGAGPTNATQLSILAIDAHEALLRRDRDTDRATVIDPDPDAVRVELTRRTKARDAI